MPEKVSITLKAQHSSRIKSIRKEADKKLALKPTESWRSLTAEVKEVILYRLYGGDTVKSVCELLDISPGLINMAAYQDPDGFGKELAIARANGSFTQADMLLDIPYDDTMSSSDKKLLSDNIKYFISRMNRDAWGEHIKVDQNVTVQPVQMPDWSWGQTIEGQVISRDTDPDVEE